MDEELARLDQADLTQANRHVARWQSVLAKMRNAELLGELVDYHLRTGSQGALKVLLSLKDLHSPDFFAKLHESLTAQRSRLAALRLLAHILNGQASWLYKLIESPVFTALLNLLRSCTDLVILTSAAFVMCALLPLTPFYVSRHLADLCEVFTRLATLKSAEKCNEFPQELLLCLNVAVYYLFLQLYSMFPCNFINYLRGRFGPTGEVQSYQEYIAPLFRYVQLHPNLITTLADQELNKTRWSSLEPHDVATLSLSVCMDLLLVPGDDPAPLEQLSECRSELPKSTSLSTMEDHSQVVKSGHSTTEGSLLSGKLSTEQMSTVWSPTIMYGLMTPSETSRTSSQQGNPQRSISSMSSPASEPSVSASSSLRSTPLPPRAASGRQALSNYSPTASLETDLAGLVTLPSVDLHESPTVTPRAFSGKSHPEKQPLNLGSRKSGVLKDRLSSVFQWWSSGSGGQTHKESPQPLLPHTCSPTANASLLREQAFIQSEKVSGESRLGHESEGRKDLSHSLRPASLTMDLSPVDSGDGDQSMSPISSVVSSPGNESTRSILSSSLPIPTDTIHHASPDLPLLHHHSTSFPAHNLTDTTVFLAQAKLQQMAVNESCGTENETKVGKDHLDQISPPLQVQNPHQPISCRLSRDSMSTLEASTSTGREGVAPLLVSHTVLPAKREQYNNSVGRAGLMLPSPVGILDQFIQSGALLHRASARDFPITELEGVDWTHFGGCPHSEELGIMTAHVAMLHSQLLFERHQCQQHARRNRRLLSKARTAIKLESEIISLSDQIHHQEATIQSLKGQLQKQRVVQEADFHSQLRADHQAVQAENRRLSESLKRQASEMDILRTSKRKMAEELEKSQEHVFKLENKQRQLIPQINEGMQLKAELDTLMKEHLVVEELYHQQQLTLAVLRRGSTDLHQAKQLSTAVQQENQALKEKVASLQKEVRTLTAQLQESRVGRDKQEEQIAFLKTSCQQAQNRSREKIESIENKYQTVKAINLTLEAALLESRGRPYRRIKGHHSAMHKRSSSIPTLAVPLSQSYMPTAPVLSTTTT